MSKSAALPLDSDKYFWTPIAWPTKDQHSKTTAMMGTAVAAAGDPIPLELRLRLSRLHVRFKLRRGDEIISIQADSVSHREVSEMPVIKTSKVELTRAGTDYLRG
jgi:hypothetical protein